MHVLLAEKPSVAESIGRSLGITQKQRGHYLGTDPNGRSLAITWAYGHLVELASPEHYLGGNKSWSATDLPILPSQFLLQPRAEPSAKAQLNHILELFAQAEHIIVATDAGREGELIFRYIYQLSKHKPSFSRLWTSSLTPEAIRAAYSQLRPGHELDSLYLTARLRAEADWLVGINATRALTLAVDNGSTLSLGRVQTPVLAMIAARTQQHQQFTPSHYYLKALQLDADPRFTAVCEKQYTSPDAARAELPRGSTITCTESKTTTVNEKAPTLLDLTSLQRLANRRFGMTAEETLNCAQNLYEQQLITYPRTDSAYLTQDMAPTLPQVLKTAADAHPAFERALQLIQRSALPQSPFNDSRVTDHHAIIPTEKGLVSQLTELERNIYLLVCARTLQAFMPACVKNKRHIVLQVNTTSEPDTYHARSTTVLDKGWTALEPAEKEIPDQDPSEQASKLPQLEPGDSISILDRSVLKRTTQPKPLYTDDSLLAAMESAGKELDDPELRETMKNARFGTPATRANIIQTLIDRGYIKRSKRSLVATPTGIGLIQLLAPIPQLTSPELTAEWEQSLNRLLDQPSEAATFARSIRELTSQLVSALPEAVRRNPSALGGADPISCPSCHSGQLRPRKAGLACTSCDYILWRTHFGKELTDEHLTLLISGKSTPVLKGFKSKAGTSFSACLQLEETLPKAKVKPIFPPSQGKSPTPARPANAKAPR